jgi:hypothetical protein
MELTATPVQGRRKKRSSLWRAWEPNHDEMAQRRHQIWGTSARIFDDPEGGRQEGRELLKEWNEWEARDLLHEKMGERGKDQSLGMAVVYERALKSEDGVILKWRDALWWSVSWACQWIVH